MKAKDGTCHGWVGPYQLETPLAGGGSSRVWRARDARGDAVAIKLLGAPGRGAQLRHELRTISRLEHPGIVRVHASGLLERDLDDGFGGVARAGGAWLAMELAAGTLSSREPRDYAEARAWFVEILRALAHAHARGVLHRDLKPANVLVGFEGRLRLADFGLASARRDAYADTTQLPGGTPGFASPEQILESGEEGPWTDLFALGALAWRACSGALPFGGEDTRSLLQSQINDPLPPLRARFAIPRELERWLRWLLSRHWQARPALAAQALEALPPADDLIEGDPGDTPEPAFMRTQSTLCLRREDGQERGDPGASGHAALAQPRAPLRVSSGGDLGASQLHGQGVLAERLLDAISQARAHDQPRLLVLSVDRAGPWRELLRRSCRTLEEEGITQLDWTTVRRFVDPWARLGASGAERATQVVDWMRERASRYPRLLVLDHAASNLCSVDVAATLLEASEMSLVIVVMLEHDEIAARPMLRQAVTRLRRTKRTLEVDLDSTPQPSTAPRNEAAIVERLGAYGLPPQALLTLLRLVALAVEDLSCDSLQAAAATLGVEQSVTEILDILADAHLLRYDGLESSMDDELLRESLLREMNTDTLAAFHLALADAIEAHGSSARKARALEHRLGARRSGGVSVEDLEAGVLERLDAGDIDGAERLRERFSASGAHLPPLRGRLMAAQVAVLRGDPTRALALLPSHANTPPEHEPRAALVRGMSLHKEWKRGAAEQFQVARDGFARMGDERGLADATHGLAESTKFEGDVDGSLPLYAEAIARYDQLGLHVLAARSQAAMVDPLRRLGRFDEATALLREAIPVLERTGTTRHVGLSYNLMGDLALARGDLGSAIDAFERAVAVLQEIRSGDVVIARLNLGIAQLRAGLGKEVLASIASIERGCVGGQRAAFIVHAHAMEAAASALEGDLPRCLFALQRMAQRQRAYRDDEVRELLARTRSEASTRAWGDVAALVDEMLELDLATRSA